MEGKLPLRQGITAAAGGIPKEKLQPHALKFGQAAALGQLAGEYAFYTPALIHMKIRLMGRNPTAQFIQEYGHEVVPFSTKFDKPIFHGLTLNGTTAWNHVLFAMSIEHWPAFKDFMGTMAFVDRALKLFARVRTREFAVADPIYFAKAIALPAQLPTVPITVFCLDTNQGCAWIEPGAHPLLDLPALRTSGKVYPDTAVFAQALFAEEVDPYLAANRTGPAEALPHETNPVRPPLPVPLESLPASKQDAMHELVRQYKQRNHG